MMLSLFLCPFVRPRVGVARGFGEDDDSEIAADAVGSASSGILHGFFILSVFCHLQHCHIATAGHRLQVGSGPFLLAGVLASGVPALGRRRFW